MRRRGTQVTLMTLLASCFIATNAQQADQPSTAMQLKEMLGRTGHSPTTEEIQAIEMAPGVRDADVAREAEPLILKALSSPDAAMRKFVLAALVGMQVLPDALQQDGAAATQPAAKQTGAVQQPAAPAAYTGEVAKVLAGAVPAIGDRLKDEDPEIRTLAATVLGGFSVDTPGDVFPPLLDYLKRDDAVGSVGLGVVSALLQLGQVSDATASALAKYVRRTDQTTYDKTELVEAIGSKPNQSRVVNQALISYLESDDASLRARMILSLPQMDLTAETFAKMKARVATLAAGGQDSPPVVAAAKSVVGCWTAVKMVSGCPVY